MAKLILIMGESGSGKTTAMRNLTPEETSYVDCDRKGLSWKGWREQYNREKKNYFKTSSVEDIFKILAHANSQENIKNVVIDTINAVMIDHEMENIKQKGYDKWVDLAYSVYDLISKSNLLKDDLNIIYLAHSQTDRDENGYSFTKLKTNGRKLDKVVLESKFTTVLLAKCVDGKYIFETQANNSTAKSPLGAIPEKEVDNDIVPILEMLKDY